MAFARKASPAPALMLTSPLPQLPHVPDDIKGRYESAATWDSELSKWWIDFKEVFTRNMGQLSTQIGSDETSTASSLASIQSSLSTINTELASIQQTLQVLGGAGGLSAAVTTLTDQITALLATVNAHIAAVKAHGTATDVVGISDVQQLDSKTIGLAIPGYGRFQPCMGVGSIAFGQNVQIPSGSYLVVGGAFTVVGTLVVAGTLVAL